MAKRARAPKPAREQVAMTHPTGGFTVLVSPSRALVLKGRGYRSSAAPDAPKVDRSALIERAKAAGVPAKGTNEALLAAVVAAESGASTTED